MVESTQKNMTKLKEIELDIFRAFVSVCEKLNLRYYIVGGTLIGAIRHQGFIPWDDDIDIAMPRKDYEMFMEKAPSLLPKHYFIQNIFTDREYTQFYAKIRNSETTYIETTANKLKINHGIFIDIFPLDYFHNDVKKAKIILRKKKIFDKRIAVRFNYGDSLSLKRILVSVLLVLVFPSIRRVIEKRDKMLRSVPEGAMYASYGGAWGIKEIAPVEWFGEGAVVTFEGMKVMAPVEYHRWLTQVYGDYMQLPPEEKRIGHHYTDIIDVEKSYKHYIRF